MGLKQATWKRKTPQPIKMDIGDTHPTPLGTKRKNKKDKKVMDSGNRKKKKLKDETIVLSKMMAKNFGLAMTMQHC